ncbi:MAG: helicase-associated domain-containing protein [Clostridiales bacterium]|jgi:hypothetical protein|nr:helicase-associated domain-containing protein [Clostridiales bacterium]
MSLTYLMGSEKVKRLCHAADLDIDGKRPRDCFKILDAFYEDPDRLLGLYNRCSDGEKALIQLVVWNRGYQTNDQMKAAAAKHGMKACNDRSSIKILEFMEKGSLATALFPDGYVMPKELIETLYPLLRLKQIETNEKDYEPEDKHVLICREDRVFDFLSLSTICSNTKIAKDKNGFITNASLARIQERGDWPDVAYCNGVIVAPKKATASGSIMITSEMYLLAQLSGLLNEKSNMFMMLQIADDAEITRKMLEYYLSSNEFQEAPYFIEWDSHTDYCQARADVMDRIETLTPGVFYKYEAFEDWVQLTANGFARRNRIAPLYSSWNEYSRQALEIFLCGFCAMGIVDLAFRVPKEEESRICGVRLTKLGTCVLGKWDDCRPKPREKRAEAGLVVTPDHFVIVDGHESLSKHSPFLEKCTDRTKTSPETATFKLTFQGFANGLDKGLKDEEIKEYLVSNSSKPVPENVLKTLDDWIERSRKIRIRTITIVEVEDESLFAEIESIKGLTIERIPYLAKIEAVDVEKLKRILKNDDKYARLEEEN